MTCENIILLLIQLSVAIILFFTYIAVKKYVEATIKLWEETAKQTKEMVKQTEETMKQTRLSMRPIVVITYDEHESDPDKRFKYINYGNTPAFYIKIDDVNLIDTEGGRFDYVFPEEYCVPQSSEISIENIKKKINGEISDTDSFDLGALIRHSAQKTFNVKIKYINAEKEEYITEGKLGIDTFDITRIEKIT